jgi:DNA-binding NarL/FixJ family response regulator
LKDINTNYSNIFRGAVMNKAQIAILTQRPIILEGLNNILSSKYSLYQISEIKYKTTSNYHILIIDDSYYDGKDIIKLIENIKVSGYLNQTIIYTNSKDAFYLKGLISKKIRGIVHEKATREKISEAIELLLKDGIYIDNYITSILISNSFSCEIDELLSRREKEIVALIAKGKKNQQIAEILFISSGTVEAHKTNIVKKLKLESTSQLSIISTLISRCD